MTKKNSHARRRFASRTTTSSRIAIKRLEEELFQHRLKRFTNQLENTNLIRSARREIARCQTVLSARAHGSEQAREKQPQAEEK